jgi:hypothetical protein
MSVKFFSCGEHSRVIVRDHGLEPRCRHIVTTRQLAVDIPVLDSEGFENKICVAQMERILPSMICLHVYEKSPKWVSRTLVGGKSHYSIEQREIFHLVPLLTLGRRTEAAARETYFGLPFVTLQKSIRFTAPGPPTPKSVHIIPQR